MSRKFGETDGPELILCNPEGDVQVPFSVNEQGRPAYNGIAATKIHAKDDAESETTSETFVEKLKLTTPELPAGEYLVVYTAEMQAEVNSTVDVKLELDDSTIICEATETAETTPDWMPTNGHDILDLPAGIHELDIDFKSSSAVKTVKIRRARISLLTW